MKRIYHHYLNWEDYIAGMWRTVSGKERAVYFDKAIEFTGNAELYGHYMMLVTELWPISCEQNLTDSNINQKAWIGHAACCLAIGCPEDITRQAWGRLTQQQQDEANNKAGDAIAYWNEKQDQKLYHELGEEGLSGRNTGRSRREVGGTEQGAIVPDDMQSDTQERFGAHLLGVFEAEKSGLHDAETHRNRGEK